MSITLDVEVAPWRLNSVVLDPDSIPWRLDLAPKPPKRIPIPLPESLSFDNVKGREGSLMLIQHSSSAHASKSQRSAARSLGLGKVHAASIRPNTPAVRGSIRTIRHLISVIDLGGVQYKQKYLISEKTGLEYEVLQFGSNTRPGELVRSAEGDYFSFESDRRGVLLNWSSAAGLAECILNVGDFFPSSLSSTSGRTSVLGLQLDDNEGAELEIVEVDSDDVPGYLADHADRIAMARVAFSGFDLTWSGPSQRFDDSDFVSVEVGIYTRAPELVARAGEFARKIGPRALLDEVQCVVLMRENGNVRVLPV